MNKYQEALDYLAVSLQVFDETVDDKPYREELDSKRETARKELQELVYKATPKKPKIRAFNEAEPWDCADYLVEREACPLCGRKLLDKDPYCYICGQAIDWSTDDE